MILAFPEFIPHIERLSIDMLYTGTAEQMTQNALGKTTLHCEVYSVQCTLPFEIFTVQCALPFEIFTVQ